MSKLLPCPFCGGDPIFTQGFAPHDDANFVDCKACGVSTKIHASKGEAIAAWNRRAALASSDAQADGGKSEAVATLTRTGRIAEWELLPGAFSLSGGKHTLYAAPQAECAPRDAITELERIAYELRAYNPAADEYKGEHICKVWAREIDIVIEQAKGSK